jgi:hypothetical protein
MILPNIPGSGPPEKKPHYVSEPSDSQMAWYMLGKEYLRRGETVKAKYCFAQAGEVYEALETDKLAKKTAPAPEDVNRETKRKAARRLLALFLPLASLLLGILLLSSDQARLLPANDAKTVFSGDGRAPARPAADSPAVNGALPTVPDIFPEKRLAVYVHDRPFSPGRIGGLLSHMLFSGAPVYAQSVLLQPDFTADGRWLLWPNDPRIVLSVNRSKNGETDVLFHDRELCNCTPARPPLSTDDIGKWKLAQEQLLVLHSAVFYAAGMNGDFPGNLRELAQDYPRNHLSGYTPLMEQHFAAAVQAVTAHGERPDGNRAAGSGEGRMEREQSSVAGGKRFAPAGTAGSLPPLEIIVDTANYRLALVSGSIILRNYPVGLGGERTPKGEFVISEKVRNPNGRADGDFGSRGMTLSDTLYAIHGTNEPDSIGQDDSLGCIRMLNEDIEELFAMVPLGTKVTVTSGLLPDLVLRSAVPFALPAMAEETNPGKIYNWL